MKSFVLAVAGMLALSVGVGLDPAVAVAKPSAAPTAHPRPPAPTGDEVLGRAARAHDAFGTDTVAVIRAYWTSPDSTTQADVVDQFDRAAAWFTEVSHGQFTIRSAAAPSWVRIAASSTCLHVGTLMHRAIAAQRAATPGFRPQAFDHVAVYFPHESACSFAGLAQRPGHYVWLNGVFPNGFTSLDRTVTTHELGHNLGLAHASSITCTTNGTPSTFGGSCGKLEEYGDVSDDMGSSKNYFEPDQTNVPGYFNAAQMVKLKWLHSSLRTVTPCAPIALAPYEGDAGVRAVRFRGAKGTTYWLEWRHPSTGTVDEGLPAGLKDGALLHVTLPKVQRTILVDARPATPGAFGDAAIPSGGSVTTPDGYTISVGGASTSLSVQLSTSRPTPPVRVRAHGIAGGALVSWSTPKCAGSSPITSYLLYVRAASAKTWRLAGHAGADRRSFRIGGLLAGHRYVVRVIPKNAHGPSVRTTDSPAVKALAPHARARVAGPRLLRAGGHSTQTLVLTDQRTHHAISGAKVTLQTRAGHRPWHRAAVVRTSRRGIATVRIAPRVTTSYRWVYAGDPHRSATISPVVRTRVASAVGVQQTARTIKVHAVEAVYGTLLPARPGVHVSLQVRVGQRWVTAQSVATARQRLPNGRKAVGYVFRFRGPKPGRLVLRVVSRATASNAVGISRVVTVRVT